MTIVAIDSNYEEVTQACQEYRTAEVYPELAQGGSTIRPIAGAGARRAAVAAALVDPQVRFVSGSGHGLEKKFTGADGEPLLEIGAYAPSEAAGKIVHLLSCLTAAELGPDLVRNGCEAFFGYDVVFMFPLDQPEAFLDCDAQIDLALAAGRTAAEAYEAAFDAFTAQIVQMLAAGKPYLAAALEYNRDHLCAPSVDAKFGKSGAVAAP